MNGWFFIACAIAICAMSWMNVQQARISADVKLAEAGCVRK